MCTAIAEVMQQDKLIKKMLCPKWGTTRWCAVETVLGTTALCFHALFFLILRHFFITYLMSNLYQLIQSEKQDHDQMKMALLPGISVSIRLEPDDLHPV